MTDRLDEIIDRDVHGSPYDSDHLDTLVTRALEDSASRRLPRDSALSRHFVELLRDNAVSESHGQAGAILKAMRDARISDAEIVDHYIPEAARSLGADWHASRRSFADVTIGTARLQSLLRDFAEEEPTESARVAAPGIALVVMPGEFHTLGAMVLGCQLRRLGASVRIFMGESADEICDAIAADQFDAVLLTISRDDVLASVSKLAERLRMLMSEGVPLVVGGRVCGDETAVKGLSGADHVANDAEDAFRKCGLKAPEQVATPSQARG